MRGITTSVLELCRANNVEIIYVDTMAQLGKACGIEVGARFGSNSSRFKTRIVTVEIRRSTVPLAPRGGRGMLCVKVSSFGEGGAKQRAHN